MNKYLFKVLIAGYSRAERNKLLSQIHNGVTVCDTGNIIGTSFAYHKLYLPDREATVALQIWDLDEKDRFRSITPNLCGGAMGAILFFNRSHKDSMYQLEEWVSMIRRKTSKIPILLCGMCSGEYSNLDEVCDTGSIDEFQMNFHINGYVELNQNSQILVEKVFTILTDLMIENQCRAQASA